MFCSKCGNEMKENETKCPFCGNEVQTNARSVTNVSSENVFTRKTGIKYGVKCKECGHAHEHLFNVKELILLVGGAVLLLLGLKDIRYIMISIIMIYCGINCVNNIPCPACGRTPAQIKLESLEKKRFGALTKDSNTNFYKTLYKWNKQYKARIICSVLTIVLAIAAFLPFIMPVTGEVSMLGISSGKRELGGFMNVVSDNADSGEMQVIILVISWAVVLLCSFFGLRYKERLYLFPKIALIIFSSINMITALSVSEPIMNGVNIATNMGGIKLLLIFLQICVITFAVLTRMFDKAEWLNKKM